MQIDFLSSLKTVSDPRIVGMTTYPLEEILLAILTGVLCRGEDFDEIEYICTRELSWLRAILPYQHGIAPAKLCAAYSLHWCPRSWIWLSRRGLLACVGGLKAWLRLTANGCAALELIIQAKMRCILSLLMLMRQGGFGARSRRGQEQ